MKVRKPHPPPRRCGECGSIARRRGDLCRDCEHGAMVLTGGAWVIDLRRRILVREKAS